jgi:hypothetical protein
LFRPRPINTNFASIHSLSISFPSLTLPKFFALTFQQVSRFLSKYNISRSFSRFDEN